MACLVLARQRSGRFSNLLFSSSPFIYSFLNSQILSISVIRNYWQMKDDGEVLFVDFSNGLMIERII